MNNLLHLEDISKRKQIKSLFRYLHTELSEGKIDFSVRAKLVQDDVIEFYIHPTGKDGDTQDYILAGNPENAEPINSEITAVLTQERERIVGEIEKIPHQFPERESDEYDAGYRDALSTAIEIVNKTK